VAAAATLSLSLSLSLSRRRSISAKSAADNRGNSVDDADTRPEGDPRSAGAMREPETRAEGSAGAAAASTGPAEACLWRAWPPDAERASAMDSRVEEERPSEALRWGAGAGSSEGMVASLVSL
jgi:hypothetical protein